MFYLAKIAIFYFGAPCPGGSFFGFPHWWEYLDSTTDPASGACTPMFTFPNDLLAVGLAVTSMLLYLAGIAALVSIIIAGVGFITAGGNAEKAASARRRIINSAIGLMLAIMASVLVAFVGNSLGP